MKFRTVADSIGQKPILWIVFILFIGMSFSLELRAEEVANVVEADSVVVVDHFTTSRTPENVNFRVPKEEKIKEFKKQKEFDYTEEPPKLNLIQRLIDYIIHFFTNTVEGITSLNVMMYPVIIILVILLLFIIFKVFKIDPRKLLGRKKLEAKDDINFESENVHEMNFAELIAKAISSENFRLAVRYLYLRNLKKMSDKELVVWNPNKTNTNYVQEIKDDELRKHFFRTSLIFDYVWYGEMKLDGQSFDMAKSELETFDKLLNDER